MHVLLLLFALLLLPALVRLMRDVIAVVALLALVLIGFLLLPAWFVILAVFLIVVLAIGQGVADADAAAKLRASTVARIREMERRASDSSRSFTTHAEARHEAFRLRSQIDDWEGWP